MEKREKQQLFKMTEIEQNMLEKALWDIRSMSDEVLGLMRKTRSAPGRRLYLSASEYRWAVQALNELRTAFLAAGRYSDGIDAVMLKLMKSKYRRPPAI